MTDGETLYLVLVILYLLEGAAWVPRGSIALCARSADWALPRLPHRTIGNARGGAVIGFPFLTNATVFIVPQWPVSLSPDGVLFWVAESMELEERPDHPGHFFHFDAIRDVSAHGRNVWLNGESILELTSPNMARQLVEIITHLQTLPRNERAAAIDEFLAKRFDVEAAKSRLRDFYAQTAGLRTSSFVLWLVTLVLVPALAMRLGFERIWIVAIGAVYLATWVTATLWVRLHRKYFPLERLERWGYAIMLGLVPVSGMRAVDLLAKKILHDFHPAAAVAAVAPQNRLKRFLSYLLRDARHPMLPSCPTDDPDARATEAFYRNAMTNRMAKMASSLSFNPDELSALPAATGDIEGEMCCPRCHARYAPEMRVCEDCGGVGLEPAKIKDLAVA
ncbi:MAG: hypothetical protein IPM54_37000 [Polyangiaceae bacterium]|nr:hypothetical protein [Polyangiaceae bacterium]